ncbi:Nif3-like dinuclear metal center hexameric protein [Clostridium sp. MCC353]|uniref:Nif3-like dinuclear metal center hexameric protein n=1 Tax=Clostridium sp. MCC353 TaxID=2592646 RepID=UPI001C00C567|nr:Nif3-like dinuclear metal center hexameric protein [Clostridium sp. MCC353]MBT9777967.1 Nif3-like dinuclear metal center hexameric protein [Clostridium sp. MCC353]
MKCEQIINLLEQLADVGYACEWDNPGLLAGRMDRDVKRIVIALDATDDVVDLAVSRKADMLLTHHPLIFKAVKKVNDQDFIGRRLLNLIENGISYYAMHTNFDIAPGCMADLAAGFLKLTECGVLEITGQSEEGAYGIGKVGLLPHEMTLGELGTYVKDAFGLPFVTVYGMDEIKEPVRRIAVSPGSGSSMISHGLKAGVRVLVTGDIGHHEGIDAVAGGMAVIDAGHYGVEHIFIEFMADYINKITDGQIEIIKAAPAFPAAVIV